jgi:hypothetical protein
MVHRFLLAASLIVASSGPNAAAAQVFALNPIGRSTAGSWSFDVGGQMAQPIGAFRTQVDRAWGFGGSVRHHFRWFEPLGIRGDVAWLNYGSETKRVPLSPTLNRVLVDMQTMNNFAVFTGGPELTLPNAPIQPYVYAFAGYSYFYTESSARDDGGGNQIANTTNFDDGGWATGYGGGLRLPLRFRSVEAAVDAGARLTRNGTRTYLRRGDIIDLPDGSLQLNRRTTAVDFWQYHLGMSFSPRHR